MGRIAGIDFGMARIGLAISDTMQILSTPLKAIPNQPKFEDTATLILKELAEFSPETIVLGLPLHLSGKESPQSEAVRKLAGEMEKQTNTPVVLWDERLTTAQVEKTLKEAEMSRKKRAKYIDAMAASAILQSYLDSPR